MNSNSISFKDAFLWISSIIGFIVDTFALIALVSQMNIVDVTFVEPSSIPKLSIGSVAIGWKEITLVLLVYVGIAFVTISIRTVQTDRLDYHSLSLSFVSYSLHLTPDRREDNWTPSSFHPYSRALMQVSFLAHFLTILIALWFVLFHSRGDIILLMNMTEGWLIGFLMLLFLRWKRFDFFDISQNIILLVKYRILHLRIWHYEALRHIYESDTPSHLRNRYPYISGYRWDDLWQLLIAGIFSLLLVLPVWLLLQRVINPSAIWQKAISTTLFWGVTGVFVSSCLWIGSVIIVLIIGEFLVQHSFDL